MSETTVFTFDEETAPENTRAAKPNPFTDPVARLVPGAKTGLSFNVPAGTKLSVIRSQLDRAGAAALVPVSIHWKVTPAADAPKGEGPARIFIRATPKITQNRKPKEAPAVPETPETVELPKSGK
jgi:hypothetical protein